MHQNNSHRIPISVIMPVYNAGKYLKDAISSILDQDFKDFEFIIINDCSKDNSVQIIKGFTLIDKRIKVIENDIRLGICKTLNKGIKASKGNYIARMDADDWSYPYRLQKQYDFMESNKNVGVMGGAMLIINEKGTIIGKREYPLSDFSIRRKIFRYSPFSHPSIIMRKNILNISGLYESEFEHAEDYELYFRIGKYSKFANINIPLIKYRVIEGSITKSRTKEMELKTLKIRRIYAKSGLYKMNIVDKLYNILQYFSVYLIPTRLKLKMFNLLRNSR